MFLAEMESKLVSVLSLIRSGCALTDARSSQKRDNDSKMLLLK